MQHCGPQLWFHLGYRGARPRARVSALAPAVQAFALLRRRNRDSTVARGSRTFAEAVLLARLHASPTATVLLPPHQLDRPLPESARSLPRPAREGASARPSNQLL